MKRTITSLLVIILMMSLGTSAMALNNANTLQDELYPIDDTYITAYAAEVLRLVNDLRTDQGLASVQYTDSAQDCVNARSVELSGKFGHISPNGEYGPLLQKEYGFDIIFTIENISKAEISVQTNNTTLYASAAPEELAAAILDEWQSSAGHYASTMRTDVTRMCVGFHISDGYAYSALWLSTK